MYSITTDAAPKPLGASSQGTTAARFVFVSAQLPVDPETGERVPVGIGQQTARCIRNVEAVLSELELPRPSFACPRLTPPFPTSWAAFVPRTPR